MFKELTTSVVIVDLDIIEGKATLVSLEAYILNKQVVTHQSGRQEWLLAILNQYLLEV